MQFMHKNPFTANARFFSNFLPLIMKTVLCGYCIFNCFANHHKSTFLSKIIEQKQLQIFQIEKNTHVILAQDVAASKTHFTYAVENTFSGILRPTGIVSFLQKTIMGKTQSDTQSLKEKISETRGSYTLELHPDAMCFYLRFPNESRKDILGQFIRNIRSSEFDSETIKLALRESQNNFLLEKSDPYKLIDLIAAQNTTKESFFNKFEGNISSLSLVTDKELKWVSYMAEKAKKIIFIVSPDDVVSVRNELVQLLSLHYPRPKHLDVAPWKGYTQAIRENNNITIASEDVNDTAHLLKCDFVFEDADLFNAEVINALLNAKATGSPLFLLEKLPGISETNSCIQSISPTNYTLSVYVRLSSERAKDWKHILDILHSSFLQMTLYAEPLQFHIENHLANAVFQFENMPSPLFGIKGFIPLARRILKTTNPLKGFLEFFISEENTVTTQSVSKLLKNFALSTCTKSYLLCNENVIETVLEPLFTEIQKHRKEQPWTNISFWKTQYRPKIISLQSIGTDMMSISTNHLDLYRKLSTNSNSLKTPGKIFVSTLEDLFFARGLTAGLEQETWIINFEHPNLIIWSESFAKDIQFRLFLECVAIESKNKLDNLSCIKVSSHDRIASIALQIHGNDLQCRKWLKTIFEQISMLPTRKIFEQAKANLLLQMMGPIDKMTHLTREMAFFVEKNKALTWNDKYLELYLKELSFAKFLQEFKNLSSSLNVSGQVLSSDNHLTVQSFWQSLKQSIPNPSKNNLGTVNTYSPIDRGLRFDESIPLFSYAKTTLETNTTTLKNYKLSNSYPISAILEIKNTSRVQSLAIAEEIKKQMQEIGKVFGFVTNCCLYQDAKTNTYLFIYIENLEKKFLIVAEVILQSIFNRFESELNDLSILAQPQTQILLRDIYQAKHLLPISLQTFSSIEFPSDKITSVDGFESSLEKIQTMPIEKRLDTLLGIIQQLQEKLNAHQILEEKLETQNEQASSAKANFHRIFSSVKKNLYAQSGYTHSEDQKLQSYYIDEIQKYFSSIEVEHNPFANMFESSLDEIIELDYLIKLFEENPYFSLENLVTLNLSENVALSVEKIVEQLTTSPFNWNSDTLTEVFASTILLPKFSQKFSDTNLIMENHTSIAPNIEWSTCTEQNTSAGSSRIPFPSKPTTLILIPSMFVWDFPSNSSMTEGFSHNFKNNPYSSTFKEILLHMQNMQLIAFPKTWNKNINYTTRGFIKDVFPFIEMPSFILSHTSDKNFISEEIEQNTHGAIDQTIAINLLNLNLQIPSKPNDFLRHWNIDVADFKNGGYCIDATQPFSRIPLIASALDWNENVSLMTQGGMMVLPPYITLAKFLSIPLSGNFLTWYSLYINRLWNEDTIFIFEGSTTLTPEQVILSFSGLTLLSNGDLSSFDWNMDTLPLTNGKSIFRDQLKELPKETLLKTNPGMYWNADNDSMTIGSSNTLSNISTFPSLNTLTPSQSEHTWNITIDDLVQGTNHVYSQTVFNIPSLSTMQSVRNFSEDIAKATNGGFSTYNALSSQFILQNLAINATTLFPFAQWNTDIFDTSFGTNNRINRSLYLFTPPVIWPVLFTPLTFTSWNLDVAHAIEGSINSNMIPNSSAFFMGSFNL